ncbi:HD domain-containing protein, partial [Candidatus Uhrbacteria bacterium]|nr:HD domain-containing protein [Candidatus Uhrbacteria bacterium]
MTFIPEDFPNFEQQEARLERALAAFPLADQERIRAAHAFAARAHEGQERFGPGHIPYLIHPIRVACSLVDEFREVDADAFAAALLHDVVEDCGVTIGEIERRFGPRVSRYVAALTWRKGADAKWQQAAAMRRQPHAARLIKASDIIDNSRAMWQVDGRARVLRLIYGYGHWGRSIIESLGAPATIFLDAALAKSTTLHFEKDPDPPIAPNAGAALTVEVKSEEGRGKSPWASTIRSLVTRHSSLVTRFARYPIRTHVATQRDDLVDIVRRYAVPYLRPSDLLAISERIVAITQGRAFPLVDIQPSAWAKFLVRFVHKSPYGIGLGSPWTMELAIREAGLPRILLAAVIAAVTKPLGVRGLFYRVVGKHINAIDGPCDYTLPISFGQQSSAAAEQQGGAPPLGV